MFPITAWSKAGSWNWYLGAGAGLAALNHKTTIGVVGKAGIEYNFEFPFPTLIGSAIEKYRFREALAEYINLARLGNKYLTDTEPWKLVKNRSSKSEDNSSSFTTDMC